MNSMLPTPPRRNGWCPSRYLAWILLTSLSFPVHAGFIVDQLIEARFLNADKDADGKLTFEEAKAGMPRVANNFDRIDVAKNGYVTLQQIKAAANAVLTK